MIADAKMTASDDYSSDNSQTELIAELTACQQQIRALQRTVAEQQRELQQIQKQFATARELFAAFNDHAPVSVFLKDLDGCFIMVNRCFCQWHGLAAPDEILGKTSFDLFPAEWANPATEMDRQVLSSKQPIRRELEILFADGSRHTLDVVKFPVFDGADQQVGIGSISIDISEQKHTQQALRTNEQRFKDFAEIASDWFWETDAELRFTWMSEHVEKVLGVSPEWHYGKTREQIGIPEDIDLTQWQAHLNTLAAHQPFRNFEYHRRGPSGDHWLRTSGEPVFDSDGQFQGYRGVGTDITERKKMEQALQKSNDELERRVQERTAQLHKLNEILSDELAERVKVEQTLLQNQAQLRQIIDLIPHMIYTKNRNGRFLLVNRATAEIYATESTQLEGSYQQHTHLSDEAVRYYLAIDRDVIDNGSVFDDVDQEFYDAHGRLRFIHFTKVRLVASEQDEPAILVVGVDMTERKQIEEKLMRQERLATLGQLTATVSHELRNPLGTMRNSVALLRRLARDERVAPNDLLDIIDKTVSRCDHIISELLDFTRTHPPQLEVTLVDQWINQLLDDYELPESIVLQREFSAPIELMFDRDRLRRAIINILDNACQALTTAPSTGQLTITSQLQQPQRLEIIVQDNGPGITAEDQEKIFEPLFSTKNFGVGLGLVIVQQIMQQHQGDIEISSEPGNGTRVILWLPLATC